MTGDAHTPGIGRALGAEGYIGSPAWVEDRPARAAAKSLSKAQREALALICTGKPVFDGRSSRSLKALERGGLITTTMDLDRDCARDRVTEAWRGSATAFGRQVAAAIAKARA